MINKVIRMKLLSDMCPASGDGFAGYVDTDICYDEQGLPYIPAKRLKGVLRECGLEIINVDADCEAVYDRLFGKPGMRESGTLSISNGKLKNYDKISENLSAIERSEILEVYTGTRTRTRIENGKAAEGSLRTMRVLNKDLEFEFPFSISEDNDSEESLKFFKMCVASLMSMGLNRSRGMGEVKCTIEDCKSNNTKNLDKSFSIKDFGDKKTFSYELYLSEPVISAERTGKSLETESYIFGSAILGAFATGYIRKNKLNRENLYKNDDFRRIFLEDGVKFTSAFPSKNGKVYYPAPTVLKTNKIRKRLYDESKGAYDIGKEDKDDAKNPICIKFGGFISIGDDGKVESNNPAKTAFMHHTRPTDKSYGRAMEQDGKLYTYEALSEGQFFSGSVIGDEADIKVLADLFKDNDTLKIGRSRTAQYGKVKIKPVVNSNVSNFLTLSKGDTFRLVAITPIILEDEQGINQTDISIIAKALSENLEIIRFACVETVISGYYGNWLLPRRQQRAIGEGSTIVFKYNGEDEITLNKNFIGERTGEGFGQFRLESVPESIAFTLCEEGETETTQDKVGSEDNIGILSEIGEHRKKKRITAIGMEYGEENRFKHSPKNSVLSRISASLKQADKTYEKEEEKFESFTKLLLNIKQPAQKIEALMFATGENEFYFKSKQENLSDKNISSLIKNKAKTLLADDDTKFEYYQKYLETAINRIMQKRRSETKVKGGEKNDKQTD